MAEVKAFDMQYLTPTSDYRLVKKVICQIAQPSGLIDIFDFTLERRHIPYKIVDGERVRDGDDVWIDWTDGKPPCAIVKQEAQEPSNAHSQP